ncbi:hypothetical protein KCU95_g12575, partial [Aureobasidium melanogenum]
LTTDSNRYRPILGRTLKLDSMNVSKITKRTAAGITTWSPTVVLICRSTAYVWQSGRDAQFSADCGRTCLDSESMAI